MTALATQQLATVPRAGTRATVATGPRALGSQGFAVNFNRGGQWIHPWQTTAHWLPDLKQWVATVWPGFVNGNAPVVPVDTGLAKSFGSRGGFFATPISAISSAGEIASAAALAGAAGSGTGTLSGQTENVKLYNNPPVAIAFRSMGLDSGGTAAVPTFFKALGVGEAPAPLTSDPNNEATAQALVASLNAPMPKGNRLLSASDIVVHQPRSALTSTITLSPGIVTGISDVQQTIGIRPATPGDVLKVFSTPQFAPTNATAIDPLAGDYQEPTWDELLVSTVYLLSPPDAPLLSQPDSSWTPFIKHSLFWNLTYLARNFIAVPQLDNITGALITLGETLAGGVASFAVNVLSAEINDATQNALNLITANSLAGTWWTSTGGGSTGNPPAAPVPVVPPANGMDRAAVLQAQSTAAARAQKAARLDPPFPFTAVPFTPSLLST